MNANRLLIILCFLTFISLSFSALNPMGFSKISSVNYDSPTSQTSTQSSVPSSTLIQPSSKPVSSSQSTCVNIDIIPGQNYVSIPYSLSDMSVSSLFPKMKVYNYDNGWKVKTGNVNVGEPLMIISTSAHELSFCGQLQEVCYDLKQGWNVIGAPYEMMTVDEFETEYGITSVYSYENQKYVLENEIVAGHVYWVEIKDPSTSPSNICFGVMESEDAECIYDCQVIYMPGDYELCNDIDAVGSGGDPCIEIISDNVNLYGNGFSIEMRDYSSFSAGISLRDVSNVLITGCNISNFMFDNSGIELFNVFESNISENILLRNSNPIQSINSNFNVYDNNFFINNIHAVYLRASSNNVFIENNLIGNPVDITGFSLQSSSDNNTFLRNNLTYVGFAIYNSNNNTFIENSVNACRGAGYSFFTSSNNLIQDNIANLNNDGILFQSFSSNNDIINNTANFNDYGIVFSQSSNNTLTDNTANSNEDHGIYLSYSSNNNTFTSNTANSNEGNGIIFYESFNNTLTNNTVNSNSNYGILLVSSSNYNSLTNNTVNLNEGDGILLRSSSNNQIMNNIIDSNIQGIRLLYGSENNLTNNTLIYNVEVGIGVWESVGNIISGNFLDSSGQPAIALDYHANGNTLINNIITNTTTTEEVGGYGTGITLSESSNNFISGNLVNLSERDGISLFDYSDNNMLVNNTVNLNGQHGIFIYRSDNNTLNNNTADLNEGDGIRFDSSSNNTLTNNTANSNDDCGIRFDSSPYNTLINNTVSNQTRYSDGAFFFDDSSNNVLINNSAINIGYDAYSLYGESNNNTIFSCEAINTIGFVISFDSNYNNISNNLIIDGTYGILLTKSSYNYIFNNTILGNREYGLKIDLSGDYEVTENYIVSNTICENGGNDVDYDPELPLSENTFSENTCNTTSSGSHDDYCDYYCEAEDEMEEETITFDIGESYVYNGYTVTFVDVSVIQEEGCNYNYYLKIEDETGIVVYPMSLRVGDTDSYEDLFITLEDASFDLYESEADIILTLSNRGTDNVESCYDQGYEYYELGSEIIVGGSSVGSTTTHLNDIGIRKYVDGRQFLPVIFTGPGELRSILYPGDVQTFDSTNLKVCDTGYGYYLYVRGSWLKTVTEDDTVDDCDGYETLDLGESIILGDYEFKLIDISNDYCPEEPLCKYANIEVIDSLTGDIVKELKIKEHNYFLWDLGVEYNVSVCDITYGYELSSRYAKVKVEEADSGAYYCGIYNFACIGETLPSPYPEYTITLDMTYGLIDFNHFSHSTLFIVSDSETGEVERIIKVYPGHPVVWESEYGPLMFDVCENNYGFELVGKWSYYSIDTGTDGESYCADYELILAGDTVQIHDDMQTFENVYSYGTRPECYSKNAMFEPSSGGFTGLPVPSSRFNICDGGLSYYSLTDYIYFSEKDTCPIEDKNATMRFSGVNTIRMLTRVGNEIDLGHGYSLRLIFIGPGEGYPGRHAAFFEVIDTTTGEIIDADEIEKIFPLESGEWTYLATSESVTVTVHETIPGFPVYTQWAEVEIIYPELSEIEVTFGNSFLPSEILINDELHFDIEDIVITLSDPEYSGCEGECIVLDEMITINASSEDGSSTTWTGREGESTVVGGVTVEIVSIDETVGFANRCCDKCGDDFMHYDFTDEIELGDGFTLEVLSFDYGSPYVTFVVSDSEGESTGSGTPLELMEGVYSATLAFDIPIGEEFYFLNASFCDQNESDDGYCFRLNDFEHIGECGAFNCTLIPESRVVELGGHTTVDVLCHRTVAGELEYFDCPEMQWLPNLETPGADPYMLPAYDSESSEFYTTGSTRIGHHNIIARQGSNICYTTVQVVEEERICSPITLKIYSGYNFISLPIEPTVSDPALLFPDVEAVWYWDYETNSFQPAESIEAGKGYVIFSVESQFYVIHGESVDTLEIPLGFPELSVSGNHLIGPGCSNRLAIRDILDDDVDGQFLCYNYYSDSYYSSSIIRTGDACFVEIR